MISFTLSTALLGRHYHLSFIDEEVEVREGKEFALRSQNTEW